VFNLRFLISGFEVQDLSDFKIPIILVLDSSALTSSKRALTYLAQWTQFQYQM
jgi:hypothetical protein